MRQGSSSLPERAPAWVAGWIDRPFADRGRGPEAFDCWGLVRAVLLSRAGVELPSFADRYASARDAEALAAIVAGEREAFEEIAEADVRELDVILLRIGRHPAHVGVVVARGTFLHVEPGSGASLERWGAACWNARVLGFFRAAEAACSRSLPISSSPPILSG